MLVPTIFLTSCIKENAPAVPLNNTVDTVVAIPGEKGSFMNGFYGSVLYIKDGGLVPNLENLMIPNGQQLHINFSKEIQPVNFIDPGLLQSTLGNQSCTIPGPDFSQYKYDLVHCKKYNHPFSSDNLQ
ncbi:MAG TPA: hypothetical protein VJU78_12290 [Chitinophagaceae bacterium]|nr:hypothetical protein [Chitinophagaceae bacterium]